MSKHTPGPWIAVGSMVEIGDDEVPDVCTCNPQLFGQGHLPITSEREYANAHLIAAAPELLEALKRLIATGLDEREYHEFMSNPAHYARAAINKATGGNE